MILHEARVLTNIRLTDNQKKVLATLIASPTGTAAEERISNGGQHMVEARNLLARLGLVTVAEDEKVDITDNGREVAKDANLVDDTGELTEEGNKYAFDDKDQTPTGERPQKVEPQPAQSGPVGGGPGFDMGAADTEGPMEQFKTMQTVLSESYKAAKLDPHEKQMMVQWAEEGGDFDELWDKLGDKLYELHFDEMPYGTQTGDDDTGDNWVHEHLQHVWYRAFKHAKTKTHDRKQAEIMGDKALVAYIEDQY